MSKELQQDDYLLPGGFTDIKLAGTGQTLNIKQIVHDKVNGTMT